MSHVHNSDEMSWTTRKEKPQYNNPELFKAIIELNFKEPLVFSAHPFLGEVLKWNPPHGLFKSNKYVCSLKYMEIRNTEEFKGMIKYLKATREWAVDLEHHNECSYAGITCLIQISTPKVSFLIDPFHLNTEIKEFLKPLMESQNHIKVIHACFNDLKWLQRDFGIFAWPVIDTQIIYRKIKTVQGKPHDCNVSLVNIMKEYFPNITLNKNCTFADFRQRPLPEKIKKYATEDVIYLIPLLAKLRDDYEENRECVFKHLLMDCAQLVAKKVLYTGKYYPSAVDDMLSIRVDLRPSQQETFKALHQWRSDLAKIKDENPEYILYKFCLAELSTLTRPAKIHAIKAKISMWPPAEEVDFYKIKDIIDLRKYEFFESCTECGESVYVLPGMKHSYDSHEKRLRVNWHPQLILPENESEPSSIDKLMGNPTLVNIFAKHTFSINKFPYSKSRQIGLYSFTPNQLTDFTMKIRECITQVKLLLKCSVCHRTANDTLGCICDCSNHSLYCKGCCWNGSCWNCPKCKKRLIRDPIDLSIVNTIVAECDMFLKRIEATNCNNRIFAIATFLRNCEMEIMCSYCFGHLQEAMLVSRNPKDGERFSLCCRGCDHFFMESYYKHGESIPSELFDKVHDIFISTLEFCLKNCERDEPYFSHPSLSLKPEVSHFRKKALVLLTHQKIEKSEMERRKYKERKEAGSFTNKLIFASLIVFAYFYFSLK